MAHGNVDAVHGNHTRLTTKAPFSLQCVWTGCFSGHRMPVAPNRSFASNCYSAVCLNQWLCLKWLELHSIWLKPLASLEGKWEDGKSVHLWLESKYLGPRRLIRTRLWWARRAEQLRNQRAGSCDALQQSRRSVQDGWEKRESADWTSHEAVDAAQFEGRLVNFFYFFQPKHFNSIPTKAV